MLREINGGCWIIGGLTVTVVMLILMYLTLSILMRYLGIVTTGLWQKDQRGENHKMSVFAPSLLNFLPSWHFFDRFITSCIKFDIILTFFLCYPGLYNPNW
jgi:hypothetical protein